MKTVSLLSILMLLFACSPKKDMASETHDHDHEPQTLLVLLDEVVSPQKVLSKFAEIDPSSIQLISRSQNQVSCKLKAHTHDIQAITDKLLAHDNIISVGLIEDHHQEVNSSESSEFSHTEAPQSHLIIATLSSDAKAEKLLAKYPEVDPKSVKLISRSENKISCMVYLPIEKMDDFLARAKAEPQIIAVELSNDQPGVPSSSTNEGHSKTKRIRD